MTDHQRDVVEQVTRVATRRITETAVMAAVLAAVIVATLAVNVMLIVQARSEALPYPKGQAQCSGSYVQSGGYCVPKSGKSPPAIPKPRNAQCPSGWADNGGSCERR